MKYKKLYLDDLRFPRAEGWEIVRSYDNFVFWIEENGLPDEVSFDHDLGEDIKTGYDCAKWLCSYCYDNALPFPSWNIHSANPVGVENIKQLIYSFERKFLP